MAVVRPIPMLDRMIRIGLGIASVVWLLTACTSPSGSEDAKSGGGEARAAKQEMDSLAEDLLPELTPLLGGGLSAMEADFVERGGYGLWDYRARGQVVRPSPREEALPEVERVLRDHGLSVETPGQTADVTGTTGNVRVSVTWTSGDAVDVADLTINTLEPASGDEDYVEEAAPTDYTAYLR